MGVIRGKIAYFPCFCKGVALLSEVQLYTGVVETENVIFTV